MVPDRSPLPVCRPGELMNPVSNSPVGMVEPAKLGQKLRIHGILPDVVTQVRARSPIPLFLVVDTALPPMMYISISLCKSASCRSRLILSLRGKGDQLAAFFCLESLSPFAASKGDEVWQPEQPCCRSHRWGYGLVFRGNSSLVFGKRRFL